jgi:hypothetical protein
VKDKRKRLEKIREAKAALEAEARAAAEQHAAEKDEKSDPKRKGGRKPKTPPGVPKDRRFPPTRATAVKRF